MKSPDDAAPVRVAVVAPAEEVERLGDPLRSNGYVVIPEARAAGVARSTPRPAVDLRLVWSTGGELATASGLVAQLVDAASAPVIAVLDSSTAEDRVRLLEAGAADVVDASCHPRELQLRVSRVAAGKGRPGALQRRIHELEQSVRDHTLALEDARIQILERLARAAEYRDDDTGEHTRRVGALAGALAEGMGVPAEEIELMRRAAPLHDVGKIGVPDGILLKPGRLTPKETEVMQAHTTIGARMLSGTDIRLLNLAATIALTHHEHWDGNGYPEGMRGEDIPLVGRIVSVADVFDALTTERPYKRAWPLEEAVAELDAQRGRQLDPDVTEVALSLIASDSLPASIREHVTSDGGYGA